MEEDMKVLQEYINEKEGALRIWQIDNIYECEKVREAIENLIKRNKELEERDRANRRVIREYNDYIPKLKVREKIKELERELKLVEGQHIDTIKAYTPIDIIKAEIKRLEELLEEGE